MQFSLIFLRDIVIS